MILSEATREEYLRTTYAAWLGKVIGVRLGAPVENWSHERIMETYGNREGYLTDYGIFAADDDTNGPLFFVRALLEKDSITAADIGDAFLNYIPEYHGFFWWGGVGVSTEHTAYENLKNGIKAPRSGSREQNGLTIAEQIGGQIFSDCWGYVAGADPVRAKQLATMASSVTHDANGIQGGIFVAAAIALAYTVKDIHDLLEETLKYLNPDMEYSRVCRDIIRYYRENPQDQNGCFDYIRGNYGYDKYPGVCHIIPNTAIMIMAMCYGENDFSKTLTMLNRCGWDTDCTCGNVGSIMGALCGLEGIDPGWITPINDIVNSSSCIGCLNIDTVSRTAMMFAELGLKLAGLAMPEVPVFHLPYGTGGYFSDGSTEVIDDALQVHGSEAYRYTYYLTDDIYDARYEPEFSPVLMPGDRAVYTVSAACPAAMHVFMEDCAGNTVCGPAVTVSRQPQEIALTVPAAENRTVRRIGVRSKGDFRIHDVRFEHHPQAEYRFADYPQEHYGPLYGGGTMNNVRGFVKHSGVWQVTSDGLRGSADEHGLISTGCLGGTYDTLVWEFVPEAGESHALVFNMQGYLHFDRLELQKDQLVLIRRNGSDQMLQTWPLAWQYGENITLKVCYVNDKMTTFTGNLCFDLAIGGPLHDLAGIAVGKDSTCLTIGLKLLNSML